MSDFTAALEYVHSTLSHLQARGAVLTASMHSLETLSALTLAAPEEAPAAPLARSAALPEPAPAARPGAKIPRVPFLPPVPAIAPVPVAPAGGSRAERLAALREPALVCTRCPHLVKSRTQVVFGVGNPEAELMFVGEAPGEDEDLQGEPFVGKAGQLLTKIIEAMGMSRDRVYIANILKCRPDLPAGEPGNRKPTGPEMSTCLPWLQQQIEIIRPRVLVALGNTAMFGLTQTTDPMARLRGRWHEFQSIPLMATYHPAYLLRNQQLTEKRKVWEDMLLVLEKLGLAISEKQQNYFTKG